MSETLGSLRRKIRSAGDLQSVVRTMKALAASNIGQYERSLRSLSDYYRTVELGLSACLREADPRSSIGDRRIGPRVIGAVVFGSDQGLVGRFNEVVGDEAMRFLAGLEGRTSVWAVGERVHARLTNAGLPMIGVFRVPSSVKGITPLVGQILTESAALSGTQDATELYLFYNAPVSGAGYLPVQRRLLPLDRDWRRGVAVPWPTQSLPEVVGDDTETLGALVREYLFVSLFRGAADSLAAENASRLKAMERADRNINELLETLHGLFHRLRQSGIDEELFDVLSGFEALPKR